jgi:hypothetical protein
MAKNLEGEEMSSMRGVAAESGGVTVQEHGVVRGDGGKRVE